MSTNCLDCGKPITRESAHGPRCGHCEYLHRKSYHSNYRKSESRKQSVRKDNDSPSGKARKRKYNSSTKGLIALHRYLDTDKGRESRKKQVLKRRAKIRQAITNLPKGWMKKLEADYPTCAYCGSSNRLSIDHLYPIQGDAGGENVYENLVRACIKCNQSKGKKLIENWFEEHREKKLFFYKNSNNIKKLNYLANFYIKWKVNPFINKPKKIL